MSEIFSGTPRSCRWKCRSFSACAADSLEVGLLLPVSSLVLALFLKTAAHDLSGMLGAAVFGAVALLVPQAPPSDQGGKVDWIGAYLGVGGLILFNFVWKCVFPFLAPTFTNTPLVKHP